MNRENDLRTLQQLTEDAAVDARKLMLLAKHLKMPLKELNTGIRIGEKKV